MQTSIRVLIRPSVSRLRTVFSGEFRGAGAYLSRLLCASAPLRESPRRRTGLTLVEVVASTLIVGVMTVAALNALGAATTSSSWAAKRAIAAGLADDLMAEIMQQAYREPDDPPLFGLESGEGLSNRLPFDDVDDYHNWNKTPPRARNGDTIDDRSDWNRSVTVTFVEPSNPSQATAGNVDKGAKRVHVVVKYRGETVAERFAIRTDT